MEQVIYYCKPSRVIFAWPLIFMWVGAFFLVQNFSWHNPGVIFVGVSILLAFSVTRIYKNAFFCLTPDKVTLGGGLFRSKKREIPLEIIEEIDIEQSLTGFFLRYGTLRLRGDHGKKAEFNNIRKPRLAKHEIERLIAETR
jgi:uncharacterized membrane protein YdbT with pleckstrin-like domain